MPFLFSVFLSFCPSFYPFVRLSILWSVCLSHCPSVFLFFRLSILLSVFLSFCPFVHYLSICASSCPLVRPSVRLSPKQSGKKGLIFPNCYASHKSIFRIQKVLNVRPRALYITRLPACYANVGFPRFNPLRIQILGVPVN